MKRKPKQDEEYDDSARFIIGVGTFDSFTEIPKDDKPKKTTQIGFIRTKPATPKRQPKTLG